MKKNFSFKVLLSVVLSLAFIGLLPAAAASSPTPSDGEPVWSKPVEPSSYIENEKMFKEGQVPIHVPLVSYDSIDAALADNWTESPYFKSLDGTWKFEFSPNSREMPENFYEPSYDVSDWDNIPVPSTWQMQGYGNLVYRNMGGPLENPPLVPDNRNPVGSYKRTFTIPESWNGRQVFLHFQGVGPAAFVWVNGEYVGYNEGRMLPAEFDITPYVQSGQNEIAVRVYRWADANYLWDCDSWRLSGIIRSVYLFSTPKIHIRDFFARPELDENYEDGTLHVKTEVKNYSDAAKTGYELKAKLYDSQEDLVETTRVTDISVEPGVTENVKLSISVNDPKKWSAEHPNLYKLVLELASPENEVAEYISDDVGFREIEVSEDNQVLINGAPVTIKGSFRWEHSYTGGRTVTHETRVKDIRLIKQFNMNAVRSPVYPNDPEWYDLTDKYGLYTEAEAMFECHSNTWLANENSWVPAQFDRFYRMRELLKNHPSIFMWCTGNEHGLGPAHWKMSEYAKSHDNRLMYHQSNSPPRTAPFTDVNGACYLTPEGLRKMGMENGKPVIMGEFNHAINNGLSNFFKHWEVVENYKRLCGGFQFGWMNQYLKRTAIVTPDKSKHGNNGVLMNNPKVVEGVRGKAVSLSGFDDWVETYRSPSLNITDNHPLTIETWVRPGDWIGSNCFVAKGNQYGLKMEDKNTIEFYMQVKGSGFWGGWVWVHASTPENWRHQWHHLAAVYTGSELKLYIDGNLANSAKWSGRISHDFQPLCIGRNAAAHGANCMRISNAAFDETRIYRKALTKSEIREDMNHAGSPSENAVLWLDFDQFEKGENFPYYGMSNFCACGMVNPSSNGEIPRFQDEYWEFKNVLQPVEVENVNLTKGKVRIKNEYDFTNLSYLDASWKLKEDNGVIQSGTLDLDVPPNSSKIVSIPLEKPSELEPGAEYWLNLSFTLPENTLWAQEGHTVAWAQFKMPYKVPERPTKKVEEMPELSVQELDGQILISGENFEYAFNKEKGTLVTMSYKDEQIIKEGPVFDPWATIQASRWYISSPVTMQKGSCSWGDAGLASLKREVKNIEVERMEDSAVKVVVQTHYAANAGGFDSTLVYTIAGDGSIVLGHRMDPTGDVPGSLPKVGLQMELSDEFHNFTWYGRGPHGTYPLRKTAKVGVYSKDVNRMEMKFAVPQNQGNRTDVRWAALTNDEGTGLLVRGMPQINVTVSRFTPESVDRAEYTYQLKDANGVYLDIDHRISGPSAEYYRVETKPYEYVVGIQPFSTKITSPQKLTDKKLPFGIKSLPPTADANGPYSVDEDKTVQLDGTGSSDPDGSVVSYSWSITSGPGSLQNADTATPTYVAPETVQEDLEVTVELTITDDEGATSTDPATITVNNVPPPNDPPIAKAGGPYSVDEGKTVQLDGTGSSDPDGDTLTYSWEITSDPTGEASLTNADTAEPTLEAPSVDSDTEITVELTVSDGHGHSDTATATVTVNNVPEECVPVWPFVVAIVIIIVIIVVWLWQSGRLSSSSSSSSERSGGL